jgi:hypothetical protein
MSELPSSVYPIGRRCRLRWRQAFVNVFQCPLTLAERAAVGLLMRLYRTASLVHRAGRYRQGVATTAEVMERVEALVRLDTWLTRHAQDLAHLLRLPHVLCTMASA